MTPSSQDISVPKHVAIIMDGNNRWARQRRLPGAAGHRAGVETLQNIVEACSEFGVEILTVFAFSSENWQRPKDEVGALMNLLLSALQKEIARLNANNIRLRFIGKRDRFSEKIQQMIARAEESTSANTGCIAVVAADYGGQWDIANAAAKLAARVKVGDIEAEDITAEALAGEMCLNDLRAPDLCIRTGGERRISNFLLWQLAYAELYFTDVYWPDFGKEEFATAIDDYSQRERRFGGRNDSRLEAGNA